MKYSLMLILLLTFQGAQAQLSLLMNGTRAATSVASLAARQKKASKAKAAAPKADAPATPVPGRGVTLFAYQGQSVPCKRTEAATFKGKGGPEILALEAMLEESHAALLADSTHSFLSATQLAAIAAADRQAVAARPDWNYAPYRQELAFYQKEEARRQPGTPLTPAK